MDRGSIPSRADGRPGQALSRGIVPAAKQYTKWTAADGGKYCAELPPVAQSLTKWTNFGKLINTAYIEIQPHVVIAKAAVILNVQWVLQLRVIPRASSVKRAL